ncbi:2Fe-2S iron-sulfur cluster-binding protein [Pedobacter superstes]|uniref:2Fe-2S iron-sulfur cluster-binding protein n=1 Tax=Pedobacter superstes TaxID=3133441 RepID=UPI003D72A14C
MYESTSLIDVKAGQSILEAALENGLPVKYSCKNGTCGSCWGRYSDGEVNMIKNHALTKEEVEDNYILLCQTYPMNDEVTVHVG